MNTSAVVLAAGRGRKMHPFSLVRSKTAIPVAGLPLILHNIYALTRLGCRDIVIVTLTDYERELRALTESLPQVRVVAVGGGQGAADSLLVGAAALSRTEDSFVVLYGDTIVHEDDLRRLCAADGPAALLAPLRETARNWIGAATDGTAVTHIGAHERGDMVTHGFAGFCLSGNELQAIRATPDYFPNVKVGVGTPRERFVEAGLMALADRGALRALQCGHPFFDVDKPWHMLEANEFMVRARCAALTGDELGENASVHPDAIIGGHVRLGRNTYIGKGVVIKGSLIAGDNTVIDNGAVFSGDAVVGDNTAIRNYCQIGDGVSIGSRCIVDHGAEMIGGLLMDKVYFYHFGEFYGAAGSHSDLGAGTVCGTLRFDDGETPHMVNGRREVPPAFANACYLGDYCRTGVGVMLMPGCTVGAYSVVGPGVLMEGDLPSRSMIRVKQEHIIRDWGENQYGW